MWDDVMLSFALTVYRLSLGAITSGGITPVGIISTTLAILKTQIA